MLQHRLLIGLVVLVLAATVGCGDDGTSDNNWSGNDGGLDDPDAGDTSGGEVTFPNIESGTLASASVENPNTNETFYFSVIGLADQPNFCSQIPSTCDAPDPEEGKVLALRLLADQEHQTGRFPIAEFDEEAHTQGETYATVLIDDYAGGPNAVITDGHVDITSHDAQGIDGSYELTLDGQTHTGTFSAGFCQNLQTQLDCP